MSIKRIRTCVLVLSARARQLSAVYSNSLLQKELVIIAGVSRSPEPCYSNIPVEPLRRPLIGFVVHGGVCAAYSRLMNRPWPCRGCQLTPVVRALNRVTHETEM